MFNVPLPSLFTNVFFLFFFSSPDIWVFDFFGIFGSYGIPDFQQKKKKTFVKTRQGHIEHVCKISGSLSKTVWTFGLLCRKVKMTRLGILIYLVFGFGQ